MKSLLIVTALLATTPALAASNYQSWTGPSLLQRWVVLNEECRGGSGDAPATSRACNERNAVDAALYSHGYCFVGMGATSRWEMGPKAKWTSRGEEATCK
jgi:hypothetical protein